MIRGKAWVIFLAFALIGCAEGPKSISENSPAIAEKTNVGSSKLVADLGGLKLNIFTYRPAKCTPTRLLIVFHDHTYQAEKFRDALKPLADQFCLFLAAPLFDEQRFPLGNYRFGGLVNGNGIQSKDHWIGPAVLMVVDWLRKQENNADMPYYLFGFSSGAQFLSRAAAVTPIQAERIVLTNPGSYVAPTVALDVPYGFRGLPNSEESLRRYLAMPITVFLGQNDQSPDIDNQAGALAQGATRFDRGEYSYRMAETVAREHGWSFNWRLVEVPGAGHGPQAMITGPYAVDALGLARNPEAPTR